MTVIEPGGAPDWQGRGAVVSATLLDLENQAWADGSDHVFDFDMGPWNTVIVTGVSEAGGAGFLVGVDFYADAGLTELIASTAAVNWSQSVGMLVLPVAARYMQIHAEVAPVNPPGSTFKLQAWATSAIQIPTYQFLQFPLFELTNYVVGAGLTVAFQPSLWLPAKYWITVVTQATVWTARITAINDLGGDEGYPIYLTNTGSQQGIPYPFVLHRRQPRLDVINGDGVARPFWILVSPET